MENGADPSLWNENVDGLICLLRQLAYACLLSHEEARRLEARLESLRAEANADLEEVIDLRRALQAVQARAKEPTDLKYKRQLPLVLERSHEAH
jgi:hypothetical protein